MAGDTEPTPRAGTKTLPDELPMRRATDRVVCHNAPPMVINKWGGFGSDSHIILQYLVSSAAIAALIVSWQVWQTLKHLDAQTAVIAPLMLEQNKVQMQHLTVLNEIHESIHAEGHISREVDAARKARK